MIAIFYEKLKNALLLTASVLVPLKGRNDEKLTKVSGVEYPPRNPAPSANDFSSSNDAPPVTSCLSNLQVSRG